MDLAAVLRDQTAPTVGGELRLFTFWACFCLFWIALPSLLSMQIACDVTRPAASWRRSKPTAAMCLAAGWGIVFGFAGGSKARIYSAAEPVGSFFGGGWWLLRGRARRWVLPTALAFGRPRRTTTRRRPLARGWCISGYFRGRAGCCGFPGGCTRPSPWISNTSSVDAGFSSLRGWI